MRRDSIRLNPRLRFTFYAVFALLFLSGAGWSILHGQEPGNETQAEWQSLLLKIHGGVAMISLVVVGILYPIHLSRGWRARRNRPTGAGLVAVVAVLIGSGYLLYYSGGEVIRPMASAIHLWVGLALPLVVFLHIFAGRVLRHRREKNAPAEPAERV